MNFHFKTFCNQTINKHLASYIKKYLHQSINDSLSTFWILITLKINMSFYVNCYFFDFYLIMKSSKLQYLCSYMYIKLFNFLVKTGKVDLGHSSAESKRSDRDTTEEETSQSTDYNQLMFKRKCLLIYTVWSSSHLLVINFLCLLSLNILSLCANMPDLEHQDNIKCFNNSDSDVNIMISSISADSTSINLQKLSSNLFMLEISLLILIKKNLSASFY